VTDALLQTAADPLADRYRVGGRPVLLTGVQAVARLLVEQHARDARAGARTASLVSGISGQPAGRPGQAARRDPGPARRPRRAPHAGMNEELGATAVWGSQLAVAQGRASNDGVVGVWYGKGPGVDRSCDVFRHANLYGASATGGALLLAGDDPGAKSSTVPCVTERTLASLSIPVLYPRTAAEVVTMGLYGVALSRESGCWVCPATTRLIMSRS
jgi:indolepyruvate ferredoxin oxidoreductase